MNGCRLFVLNTVLVASAISQGQELTVDFPATTLKKLLPLLSKAAKTNLTVSAPIDNQLLILKLTGVPLQTAMDQIAKVTFGEWQRTNDGYLLVQTSAKRSEAQKMDDTTSVLEVESGLKKFRERAQQMEVFDLNVASKLSQEMQDASSKARREYETINRLDQRGPLRRLSTRILGKIDASVISSVKVGERVVFSNHPNRMQRQLGAWINQEVAQFVLEQNIYASALADVPTNVNPGYASSFSMYTKPITDRNLKLLLVVTPGGHLSSTSIQFLLANSDGKTVGQTTEILPPPIGDIKPDELLKPSKSTPDDPVLESSAASKKLAGIFRNGFANGELGIPDFPDDVKAMFLNPEKTDPVASTPSELFLSLAKQKKKNLCVAVGDDMLVAGLFAGLSDKISASRFLTACRNFGGITVSDEQGWIVGSCSKPVTSLYLQLNRDTLGKTLRQIYSTGSYGLEERATFVTNMRGRFQDSIAPLFFMAVAPEVLDEYMQHEELLRFYGQLTVAQKSQLKSQGSLTLIARQLLPAQEKCFSEFVFGPGTRLRFNNMPQPVPQLQSDNQPWNYIASSEPTETLPSGIVGDLELALSFDTAQAVVAYSSNGKKVRGYPGGFDVVNLAMQMMMRERPELFGNNRMDDLEKFRMVARASLRFESKLTARASVEDSIEDCQPEPGSQMVAFGGLPQKFREAVLEALKNQREMYKNSKPGVGGTTVRSGPPPL